MLCVSPDLVKIDQKLKKKVNKKVFNKQLVNTENNGLSEKSIREKLFA